LHRSTLNLVIKVVPVVLSAATSLPAAVPLVAKFM
jgi:hypothetical protein